MTRAKDDAKPVRIPRSSAREMDPNDPDDARFLATLPEPPDLHGGLPLPEIETKLGKVKTEDGDGAARDALWDVLRGCAANEVKVAGLRRLALRGGLGIATAAEFDAHRKQTERAAGRMNRAPAARHADPDELPEGVNVADWRASEGFGTDGLSTWKFHPDYGWHRILDTHVRILAERQQAEDPDFPERAEDGDDPNLEGAADVLVRLRRGGQIRERTYRGVRTSKLRALSPLDNYGATAWRGGKDSPQGRSEIFQGINYLSDEYQREHGVFHTVSGWYPAPDGRGEMFVHGGGAIGARGTLPDVDVQMAGNLALLALGEPATGRELGEAFHALMACYGDVIPAGVGVPITAAGLRPLFGQYERPTAGADVEARSVVVAWTSGNYGDGKSGAIALGLNPVYPGLLYNRYPFKAGTPKNGGISGPALERVGFSARDLPLPIDDLDPAEGDRERAAWQSNALRSAWGGNSRTMAERVGHKTRAPMPFRAGLIGTGEPLDAEASAESRAVNVRIGPGDVRKAAMAGVTTAADRAVYGRLGAGVVRALAADRARYRRMLLTASRALRPLFVADGREVPGPVARGADTYAEAAATLWVVLSIVVEQGGMTRTDAQRHWTTIRAGLVEAWETHLSVISGGGRAVRAVKYLLDAISAGHVRIDDQKHGTGHPSRDLLGWDAPTKLTDLAQGEFPQRVSPERTRAGADVAGWQNAETGDLYLIPSVATAAVRDMAARAGDSWTGGAKVLGAALDSAGYVITTEKQRRKSERTSDLRVGGKKEYGRWHLRAEILTSDQGDGIEDYSGPIDTAALASALGDDPDGHAGTPAPEPDEPTPNGPAGSGTEPAGPGTVRTPAANTAPAAGASKRAPSRDAEVANAASIITELNGPDLPEAELSAAVDLFHQVTGGVELRSGRAAGVGLRALSWIQQRKGKCPASITLPDELTGDRVRTMEHGYVHPGQPLALGGPPLVEVDVNAQYLAAASMPLGAGEPTPVDVSSARILLSPKGKVAEVSAYGVLTEDVPRELGPLWEPVVAGDILPAPALRRLLDLGYDAPLAGGWRWERQARYLDGYVKVFRAARYSMLDIPRDTLGWSAAWILVKGVPNAMLGGMMRSDSNQSGTRRPDWAHHYISRAKMNQDRGIARASGVPLAVRADAAYFANPDAVRGMEITTDGQLGKWKSTEVLVTSDIIGAYESGSTSSIQRAVKAAKQASGK